MENQPLVSQEILDAINGIGENPKPPVTGNQRIYEIMQKISVPVRTTGNLNV